MITTPHLAIAGGPPVRTASWPAWPVWRQSTIDAVTGAVRSGRWTISGPAVPLEPYERRFARAFAEYTGTAYAVPTANGSSALLIAFEALGIGPGDEVIVPVLTWVATASAVLRVNATPVFVDVDRDTLCMSVELARAAITPRTAAIVPVHLHHSMADMDALLALSAETGLPIVEDASQAHGAIWKGRRAGSMGRLGTFSFQQSKVLTGGEGGAVVTDSPELFARLQQLRADSRTWTDEPRENDGMQLCAAGGVMGANYCLSELHAAILLEQLSCLDEALATRAANAEYLDQALARIDGVTPLRQPPGLDRRTVYEYLVRIDTAAFAGQPVERIGDALRAELGLRFYPPDAPLHRSPLYQPLTKKRFLSGPDRARAIEPSACRFPVAEGASRGAIVCHHAAFLGTRQDMDDIARAFGKVRRHASEL
ncbi:MAG: DegT/DnrJ/EryC1/StrS family aminotransferase [Vicinamibacterales bacterium]